MKSSYLRASVALACALGLSACGGGGSGQLVLAGTAYGISKDTLVLQNNGGSDLVISPQGGAPISFNFQNLVPVDAEYNVTVKSMPSNVTKCDVTNGKGRSAFDVRNIVVVCELKTHKLGGTITGLGNASGLVLVNGPDNKAIDPGATSFTMNQEVGEDIVYGVAVLRQPAGLNCSVSNGTGRMQTADITNVAVNCGPATTSFAGE